MKHEILNFCLLLTLPFILVLRLAGRFWDVCYILCHLGKVREARQELLYLKKAKTDDAEALIKQKYKWQADTPVWFDYPRMPLVTVMRKGGDCEDFARLYYEIIKDERRYVSYSVIYGFMKGHTMGVYYSHGKFHICSNLIRFSLSGDSFDDVIEESSKLIDPKYWFVVVGTNRLLLPLRVLF